MASENPSVGFVLKAYRKLSIEANKLVDLKHELEKALNFLLEGKDFLRLCQLDTVTVSYFNCLQL